MIFFTMAGNSSDEVVGFIPFAKKLPPAERRSNALDQRYLRLEIVRHRRTVRLVIRSQFQSEFHLAAIKKHYPPPLRITAFKFQQQLGENKGGIDRFAAGIGQMTYGIKRPEYLTVRIQQYKFVHKISSVK